MHVCTHGVTVCLKMKVGLIFSKKMGSIFFKQRITLIMQWLLMSLKRLLIKKCSIMQSISSISDKNRLRSLKMTSIPFVWPSLIRLKLFMKISTVKSFYLFAKKELKKAVACIINCSLSLIGSIKDKRT